MKETRKFTEYAGMSMCQRETEINGERDRERERERERETERKR